MEQMAAQPTWEHKLSSQGWGTEGPFCFVPGTQAANEHRG